MGVYRCTGCGSMAATDSFQVMPDFSITIDIQASPDWVMAVVCDVERWPEWTSTITSVGRMDNGPFRVGSRAHVRQPKLLPAVWEVTEFDAGRNFTWLTRSPGVRLTGRHQVEQNGSGRRVTLSLPFAGPLDPLVARLYRNLNERYLVTEAKALKDRSEGKLQR
jgi:uncharacterized membrane protein